MQFRPTPIKHSLSLPPAISSGDSVLAFSFAKAGSTLLYDILHVLSPAAGLVYFSIEDQLFAQNVSPVRRPTQIGNILNPTGYCFGGFRQFPAFPVPILHSSRVVFLVRDPRDMITSLYFSMLRSHVVPQSETAGGAREEMLATRRQLQHTDINDYAIDAIRTYVRMFEGYIAQGFHWRPNVAIYRYEDVIFQKAEWIADICDWYGWSLPQETIRSVVSQVDIEPDGERPDEHVRQVTPGNHKKHLRPETIRAINQALGEYMRLFGYLND